MLKKLDRINAAIFKKSLGLSTCTSSVRPTQFINSSSNAEHKKNIPKLQISKMQQKLAIFNKDISLIKSSLTSSSGVDRLKKEVSPAARLPKPFLFHKKVRSVSAKDQGSMAVLFQSAPQDEKNKVVVSQEKSSNFQMHQGQLTDSSGKKVNDCYILLHELRKDDIFPGTLSKEKMVELFFPKNSSDLALSLSNVTSAFYGIMLETCGKVVGLENIDKVSKDFFYKLGRVKAKITKESVGRQFEIPKDARGVVILLVSAIYNASPEYKFEIKQFKAEECEISLRGIDRYYRITNLLKIEKHLHWPVLHRFMEGIKDELSIDVDIKSEMVSIEDDGKCDERFFIKRK